MNQQSIGLFLLFTLLGMISGFALAVLVQSGVSEAAAAEVDQPSGIQSIIGGGVQTARAAGILAGNIVWKRTLVT